jgi:hypothetical protein
MGNMINQFQNEEYPMKNLIEIDGLVQFQNIIDSPKNVVEEAHGSSFHFKNEVSINNKMDIDQTCYIHFQNEKPAKEKTIRVDKKI